MKVLTRIEVEARVLLRRGRRLRRHEEGEARDAEETTKGRKAAA